jgi:kanamycin kinase
MILTPIPNINPEAFPTEIQSFVTGANLYDSSCSVAARVTYIDKDNGYFLKSAPPGSLAREAALTRYYHSKGLAPEVVHYISEKDDWLLTTKLSGDDCLSKKYLEQPKRLCDTLANRLAMLHNMEVSDCPIPNHTKCYLDKAAQNYCAGIYDTALFPDNWGYTSAAEAWKVVSTQSNYLKTDTLLHGDYCLPNIILDNWHFSGFVDLDSGGVGDRHVDIFWGIWTLFFNLKTDKYRDRFIDAYGRSNVHEDLLRVVAAVEVFE